MATIDLVMAADSKMVNDTPTTNFETSNDITVGEYNAGVQTNRSWIKPDFSSIPAGVSFVSAILKLTPIGDYSSNARTMRAHRCLRDVVASQVTWNIWKTSNNWGTGGCSDSSTDYDGSVELGNMSVPASPTLNSPLSMTFSAAGVLELQKMYNGTYVNNGIILFVDTQTDDLIQYASKEHATSAYRPIITLAYTLSSGNFFLLF